jgi:hypothetical protein
MALSVEEKEVAYEERTFTVTDFQGFDDVDIEQLGKNLVAAGQDGFLGHSMIPTTNGVIVTVRKEASS